jgi:hypothetical protein
MKFLFSSEKTVIYYPSGPEFFLPIHVGVDGGGLVGINVTKTYSFCLILGTFYEESDGDPENLQTPPRQFQTPDFPPKKTAIK